jgi:transcriptional regulator with XRE-family HTH domain
LGRAEEDRSGDELTDEELQAQRWVGEALGELLAGAPRLSTAPTRARLARVVAVYVEEMAGGNVTRFARELGMNMHTVAQWHWGVTVPSLALLLQACYRLGTTPWRLLTTDLDRLPDAERPPRPLAHLVDAPPRPRPLRRAFDIAEMRSALEVVLARQEEPPPPMRQVAKRLGQGHAELIHHLPELCHAISARYLADRQRRGAERKRERCAEIRQAAMQLHQQGIYPSAYRIAALISQPGFIRDPVAIAERKEVLRELGWQT